MRQADIAIIGGGVSGISVCIQLIRQAEKPLSILLFNYGHEAGKGIAYSTQMNEHLLNVRAGRMSLFPDQPLHFCEWIISKPELSQYHHNKIESEFLPRKLYGNYVNEVFLNHLQQLTENISVAIIDDEVINIQQTAGQYIITGRSGEQSQAAKVVLATGNFSSTKLPGQSNLSSHPGIINPWTSSAFNNLDTNRGVLIIGTGLTMADTVLSLVANGYSGTITALSRHGELPMPHPLQQVHGHHESYTPSYQLSELYNEIKKKIQHNRKTANWEEPILESIRPHSQKLWQHFSKEEKERFLRHLNHSWSRLRHRLPSYIFEFLQRLIENGQLILEAGNIINIESDGDNLRVERRLRKSDQLLTSSFQRIYNCTGPVTDINKIDNPLLKALLSNGLATACSMRLGYNATAAGHLINNKGEVSESLFTLGSGLKGIIWESTAVPEIRVQAKNLATILLN